MPLTKCQVCLKEFYIKPSHQLKGWGKFCSIACRTKSQFKGKFFKCSICGKEIYRSPKAISHSKSNKYFCNKSCQTLWRNTEYVGERSKNWKNGESTYRNILKRSGAKQVCALCQIDNERLLTVHHRDHDRTNNNIVNLVWLCLNCHYLVHHDSDLNKRIIN